MAPRFCFCCVAVGDRLGAPHAHAVSARRCRKHGPYARVFERGSNEALRMEAPSGFREINSPSPRMRFWQLGDARREVQSHPERRGGGGPARGEPVVVPALPTGPGRRIELLFAQAPE